ncbi:MAG TPA: serine/threonine-protein kinase [Planctomycetota bacterium]|nr:serine/threonine-protein kinase [Planctomycetota bacterium]
MSGTRPDPGAGGRDPLDRTQPYKPPGIGEPPPAANLPHIPGITLHFEIARGGMGVVYSGRQDFLDRRVAVKFLSVDLGGEKFAQRFRREAKILAGIKHPNIVACHSAGTTDDGQSYLIMEFIDGPNLKSWIGDNGPVACVAALRLARSVAQALAHALSLDVIHRDVKPENILLETMTSTAIDINFPFVPKLVDLGLARMTSESAGLGLTSPGSVMGTPATMSPEQYDEPDSVDFRTDIYGLGCVLYEMLVGRPAFRGAKLTDIITKKRQPIGPNPCEENPEVPAEVGGLVSRMLSANRNARPASYRELDERLLALAANLPAPSGTVIDPHTTGATIVGGGPMAPRPTQPRASQPSAPPPAAAAKTGPGLLRTAEFEFLAAGGADAASAPAAFHDGSSGISSGPIASTAVAGGTAVPVGAVGTDSRRRVLLAAAAVLGLGVATAAFFAWKGSGTKEPIAESPDAPSPTERPAPRPAPRNSPPTKVVIKAPEKVSLDRDFELTASAVDEDGDKLSYRWSSADGNPIFFKRNDRNPVEARVFDGLPGEAFDVDLEVSDGKNAPVREKTTIQLAEEGFPRQPFVIGFKTNPKWSVPESERMFWNEIRDTPPYLACRTAGELRTMTYSFGDEAYWQVFGELESRKDDRSPVFAEVGVRLELGDKGYMVRCTVGSGGEDWAIELLDAQRKDGAWLASPMQPAKRVEWKVEDEDLFGLVSIKRRRAQVSISLGQKQLDRYVSHEVSLEGLTVEPRLSLVVKGGRGSFRGFTLL